MVTYNSIVLPCSRLAPSSHDGQSRSARRSSRRRALGERVSRDPGAAPALGVIGLSFARLLSQPSPSSHRDCHDGPDAAPPRPRLDRRLWLLRHDGIPTPAQLGRAACASRHGEHHRRGGTPGLRCGRARPIQRAGPVATTIGSAIALAGVAFVCLARSGGSLSASVWIVVAAMIVQGIYHPLQRPLLSVTPASKSPVTPWLPALS